MMHFSKLSRALGATRRPRHTLPGESTALARFSNLASTAYKRHIQSLHECGDRRNPDILAGAMMTDQERDECLQLSAKTLRGLRSDPYYYYLTARTKVYDQLLLEAVAAGIRRVLIVGAGFDTRLYRFGGLLAALGAAVAECDQPAAAAAKEMAAAKLPYAQRVQYFRIDLNLMESWAELWRWVGFDERPILLVAEGVSPYIEASSYQGFLENLPKRLPVSSWLAYDFKHAGAADDFGRNSTVSSPFRLAADEQAIVSRHLQMGFGSAQVTTSLALMQTHVPSWSERVSPLFREDSMIRLKC
jgi:methyltransferase (TIGR00027 family)